MKNKSGYRNAYGSDSLFSRGWTIYYFMCRDYSFSNQKQPLACKIDLTESNINLSVNGPNRALIQHFRFLSEKTDILMNGPERNRFITAVWKVGLQRWLRLCKESDQEVFCHQLTASLRYELFRDDKLGDWNKHLGSHLKERLLPFYSPVQYVPWKRQFLSSLAFFLFISRIHVTLSFLENTHTHTQILTFDPSQSS